MFSCFSRIQYTNNSLKPLNGSSNLLIYDMHQFLNSDGSGAATSDYVSSKIGVERVEGVTGWFTIYGQARRTWRVCWWA